ncbi:MAG: flagellar hook-associated protein FlgK, partial [Gammaproteobacteria bacterium]|nr:flagellar hook-associated protein FlgK [Gammaproteobacteria bacterium]
MGLFDISVSGLLTNQTSINTTSHNIANANVEGYSRQRASQEPRLPQFIGGNYLGTGVEVATIKRIFEATEQLELQATTSSFYSYDTYLDQAKRLDGLLADSDSGVNSAIQNFFTALQGVVNDPASIPARQVMISEGEMMISRFELVYNQLESQNNEINTNIYSIAEEISSLATSIANLNNQIAGSAGSPPPDLLDKRDLQITRLSELVSVQTIQQEDGNLNVFIGTGQALVIGSFSSAVEGRLDPADPRSMRLYLASGNSSIDVTQNIVGGELGGLLKVRDELLEPAFNTLGRIAIGIADNFNAQHQLGMDLNNQLGGNFFVDINDPAIQARRVISSTANAGSSVATLTIDDPNVLVDTNYQMYLSAGNFQLVDLRDNSVVASFAQPASPASVTMPTLGFTINFLSGAAVDGDSFKIQPTRNFSQDFT